MASERAYQFHNYMHVYAHARTHTHTYTHTKYWSRKLSDTAWLQLEYLLAESQNWLPDVWALHWIYI